MYDIHEKAEAVRPCRQSKKELKTRLKMAKEQLQTFITVTDSMDINLEERDKTIGRSYRQILLMEKELESYKRRARNAG